MHPVVASVARELLNKSENERSGVVSTAMSFLASTAIRSSPPTTARSDWRIADLMRAERPVSLYLVVPPSDISRTRPLVRLILNQIARRLTETLQAANDNTTQRQLLLMLDEFPALGRLDFFESSLAFLAGYGVRAFLVAQSLHQIDKAYGPNHAILDNCHVRVAFAPNDERTAKRLSDALGTATELRAQRNLSGKRFSAWLSHTSISEQETPRPLLTPGEILQLPASDALVLVSGLPPIRASKLRYYADRNFLDRRLPAPPLSAGAYTDVPPRAPTTGRARRAAPIRDLDKAWSELVAADTGRAAEQPADMARDRAGADRRRRRPAAVPSGPTETRRPNLSGASTMMMTIWSPNERAEAHANAIEEALLDPVCRTSWPNASSGSPGCATAPSRRWSRRRSTAASIRSASPASTTACCAGSTSCRRTSPASSAMSPSSPRCCRCSCATSSPSRRPCRPASRSRPARSARSASRCSSPRSAAASPPIAGSSPRCWRSIAVHNPDLFATATDDAPLKANAARAPSDRPSSTSRPMARRPPKRPRSAHRDSTEKRHG